MFHCETGELVVKLSVANENVDAGCLNGILYVIPWNKVLVGYLALILNKVKFTGNGRDVTFGY